MITKHETSKLIRKLSTQDVTSALAETYVIIRNLKELHTAIGAYKDNEIDEDELLDAFEIHSNINHTEYLLRFSKGYCSVLDVLNKYLERTTTNLVQVCKNVGLVVETFCTPSDKELDLLEKNIYSVISGLAYFVVYEYAMTDLATAADAGEEDLPVDECLYTFTGGSNESALACAREIIEYTSEFKMKLEIFDEYPEKEIEFEKVMGPYYVGITETALTMELVDKVINGSMTPEELCTALSAEDEEE